MEDGYNYVLESQSSRTCPPEETHQVMTVNLDDSISTPCTG